MKTLKKEEMLKKDQVRASPPWFCAIINRSHSLPTYEQNETSLQSRTPLGLSNYFILFKILHSSTSLWSSCLEVI